MKVINLALDLIDEDVEQPRYNFDEESLKDLADSIKEVGLLSPIKVRNLENGRYKIVFGNRRYKASSLLGLVEIPCIISESDSELDIFIEQLTENIQRESFTAIEEAEAFERLLNENKFRISKTLLSSRLGKSERYISRKMDLLIFNKKVQQLIHNSKDIIANKLTEEQVLPLKHITIEYRDALAIKIANEQVSVKDVKRISELFTAKDISDKSKEILLNKPIHLLINDWSEYEKDKKENILKPELKVIDISKDNKDFLSNSFVSSNYHQVAVVKKLYNLLNNLPSQHELSDEIFLTIDEIKLANNEEFLMAIDGLIDCLIGHVQEWKKVKTKASTKKIGVVKNLN
jgi:ParB family chromosome partitioning protein